MGGERGDWAGRHDLRRQHRRRGLRHQPRRDPALGRPEGQSVWTTPAFGQGSEAGDSFWGSVDLYAFSLDPNGQQRWQTFTPGYVTSSPALGSDGTVYVASFDHKLYALDPDTGAVRWSFSTDAHIYGSPALATNAEGQTSAIFITSTDGSVYAIHPSGHLLWRYDTGDPIRSSPVLGRKPHGGGQILYVGSSNGKLYALYAANGRRRWSFDTTPRDPALRDRNDLNGSPALGYSGRLHRRRARTRVVRPLRLLPAQHRQAVRYPPWAGFREARSTGCSMSRPAAPPSAAGGLRRSLRPRCSPPG